MVVKGKSHSAFTFIGLLKGSNKGFDKQLGPNTIPTRGSELRLAQLEEIDAACHAMELSNANGKLVLLKAVGLPGSCGRCFS